jgi:hypothetical protein
MQVLHHTIIGTLNSLARSIPRLPCCTKAKILTMQSLWVASSPFPNSIIDCSLVPCRFSYINFTAFEPGCHFIMPSKPGCSWLPFSTCPLEAKRSGLSLSLGKEEILPEKTQKVLCFGQLFKAMYESLLVTYGVGRCVLRDKLVCEGRMES